MSLQKSYKTDDPLVAYCTKVSLKHDSLLDGILEATLKKSEHPTWVGAPEVLQLGQNMLRLIRGKRALDIGTFTGLSAAAWALAVPPDGEVLTIDVTHESLQAISEKMLLAREDVLKKITFRLGKALDVLDSLIEAGESGKWDFGFIDADKTNYVNYYEKCIQLLRPGGVLLVDNCTWDGRVLDDEKDVATTVIDQMNQVAYKDDRVDNILLNIGDGTHLIFKKH